MAGRRSSRAEAVGLHEVDDADPATRDLVDVGRTDAARGRAELARPALALLELVEQDVVGHDQVRAVADEQVGAVEPGRREPSSSATSAGGLMTTPLPSRLRVPGWKIPDGIRWSLKCPWGLTTVWPALLPPP